MDNMKPPIDAVSEDRREETATDDEAGRPNCRGARGGGQRGSSCGRRGRSGPQHRGGMTSHTRQLGGPAFMHGPSPAGPHECGYGRRMPFMHGYMVTFMPFMRGYLPCTDWPCQPSAHSPDPTPTTPDD